MKQDSHLASIISDSRLAFIQGKYDESLRLAKQALSEDTSNSDAHQCAGNAYMSKADYESAIEHYKKAIENDADNGDRYFNLGYAYASDNQPVKTLEMLAKVKVPAGTTIYTGPVATQGGVYLGGGNVMQIFINKPWMIKGIEVLGQLPLS